MACFVCRVLLILRPPLNYCVWKKTSGNKWHILYSGPRNIVKWNIFIISKLVWLTYFGLLHMVESALDFSFFGNCWHILQWRQKGHIYMPTVCENPLPSPHYKVPFSVCWLWCFQAASKERVNAANCTVVAHINRKVFIGYPLKHE